MRIYNIIHTIYIYIYIERERDSLPAPYIIDLSIAPAAGTGCLRRRTLSLQSGA